MKKDTIIKAIAIPLAIGVVLGIAFFLFCVTSNSTVKVPLESTPVAYFDKEQESIGTMNIGSNNLTIIENSNYSNMVDTASFIKGVPQNEKGVGYYLVLHNCIKSLDTSSVTITTSSIERTYKYVTSFKADNERDLLNENISVTNGIVLYYQLSSDGGFTSQYEALVYEEVQ